MSPQKSRSWIFRNRPNGLATYSGDRPTFEIVTSELPPLKDDQVLVHPLFLSNDPAQRGWLDDSDPARFYVPPMALDTPMRAFGIGEVVESTSAALPVGTIVQATLHWSEYIVLDAKDCVPRTPPPNASITAYLGAFGGNGLTAYYGLVVIGEAKAGQRIVVSGAAGATGSMVVQIAKHIVGASQVIGIAGSDEKCRWVEGLGADVCLNYKRPGFYEDLAKATDGYVDVFFDNVGGELLDFMLTRLKMHGVIAACGSTSTYNSGAPSVMQNYMQLIFMRLSLRGFIVIDYFHKAQEVVEILSKAVEDGKINVRDNEQVVPAKFEDIPRTFLKLFEGGNTGKLITKLV